MNRFALIAAMMLTSAPAGAQQDFSKVEIKVEKLAPGVAVLFGAGGNIGLSYGEDGNALVDDQFAPLTDKIVAAVKTLDPGSGALRHQHPLALRSHRRERESGQGRRGHHGARQCPQAHGGPASHEGDRDGCARLAQGRASGGDLRRWRDAALERRHAACRPRPPRAHRRRCAGPLAESRCAPHGRYLLPQDHLPVHRHGFGRIDRRSDRRGPARARARRPEHPDHSRPRPGREQGGDRRPISRCWSTYGPR